MHTELLLYGICWDVIECIWVLNQNTWVCMGTYPGYTRTYTHASGIYTCTEMIHEFVVLEPSAKVFSMKFGRAIPTYDRF